MPATIIPADNAIVSVNSNSSEAIKGKSKNPNATKAIPIRLNSCKNLFFSAYAAFNSAFTALSNSSGSSQSFLYGLSANFTENKRTIPKMTTVMNSIILISASQKERDTPPTNKPIAAPTFIIFPFW